MYIHTYIRLDHDPDESSSNQWKFDVNSDVIVHLHRSRRYTVRFYIAVAKSSLNSRQLTVIWFAFV